MVQKPKKLITMLSKLKLSSIAIHYECDSDITNLAKMIKKQGSEAGLAINPETSIDKIRSILSSFDYVQIMSVRPGQQGRKFLPKVLDKIFVLQKIFTKRIWIDGGINETTIPLLIYYNVQVAVVGSYFKNGNVKQKLARFNKIIIKQN